MSCSSEQEALWYSIFMGRNERRGKVCGEERKKKREGERVRKREKKRKRKENIDE